MLLESRDTRQLLRWIYLALCIFCFAASSIFYGLHAMRSLSDVACTELFFPNTPALEAVEYQRENFRDHYSDRETYRGPPTPDREAAWEEFAPYGVSQIPLDSRSKSSEHAVLGVVLHLNCVKLIRQYVYMTANETYVEVALRSQVNQCIEVLRRELVCNFDATLYLIANTNHSSKGTVPVTGNDHICRNYPKILHWAQQRFTSSNESLRQFSISL
ncbi:hypothetical protein V8C43DRAFT_321225 [Trichoderma afarasin]